MRSYTDALCNEIECFARERTNIPYADTVYLGGGTPSLLPVDCIDKILSSLHKNFVVARGAEITIEANPKTAGKEKLYDLKSLGINRISVGMQSACDGELKALGRIHTLSDFVTFYKNMRDVGFDNVSVDLMYGIPNQTKESFDYSLGKVIELSPEHVSSYCLKIEEGTKFFAWREKLKLPDDDATSDMYELMCRRLGEHLYSKYEISNFARNGKNSRHNTKYWTYDDYIGFGAGAYSFVGGVRFSNSRNIDGYILNGGVGMRENTEHISHRESENEYVMLRMRLSDGVDYDEYRKIIGGDFLQSFGEKFKKFSPEFVTITSHNCSFTDKGMLVSNYILSEILEFE